MHAFSILAWAIFVAGYITARWDLVTRLCELWVFAWEHGVVVRLLTCLPPAFLASFASNWGLTLDSGRQGVWVPYVLLLAYSDSH